MQRYAMEPTYSQSMCTMAPAVALVKHPLGQVVLFADHAETIRQSKAAYETNLATAEHNKRVAVNRLNAEIKVLAEEPTADEIRIAKEQEGKHPIEQILRGFVFRRVARTQEGDGTK